MDLQIKLVNDGYAQAYASPEKPNLPPWAIWKNEAYGITAEPVVIVYNKRLDARRPTCLARARISSVCSPPTRPIEGKVAMMNPERSGVGFLYITQDLQVTRDTWRLVRAMGARRRAAVFLGGRDAGARRFGRAPDRLQHDRAVRAGARGARSVHRRRLAERLHAGGVAHRADSRRCAPSGRREAVPRLPVVEARPEHCWPQAHDAGAQRRRSADRSCASMLRNMRAIRVGPELLANLDQIKRLRFLKDWRNALANSEPRAHAPSRSHRRHPCRSRRRPAADAAGDLAEPARRAVLRPQRARDVRRVPVRILAIRASIRRSATRCWSRWG